MGRIRTPVLATVLRLPRGCRPCQRHRRASVLLRVRRPNRRSSARQSQTHSMSIGLRTPSAACIPTSSRVLPGDFRTPKAGIRALASCRSHAERRNFSDPRRDLSSEVRSPVHEASEDRRPAGLPAPSCGKPTHSQSTLDSSSNQHSLQLPQLARYAT